VSDSSESSLPVGIRPAPGQHPVRLVWVASGTFVLKRGDRVTVQDSDRAWPGEVVIPAGTVLESPVLGDLPVVVRRLSVGEWPATPARAGRQMLDALGLPTDQLSSSV